MLGTNSKAVWEQTPIVYFVSIWVPKMQQCLQTLYILSQNGIWDNTIPGQKAQWAPKVRLLVLLFQNIHVEYWCDCKSYIHPASERVHG